MVEEGDFSERLLRQVDRIVRQLEGRVIEEAGEITEHLFRGDIRELQNAVGGYLSLKEETWLLVDNLDKGWPTRGVLDVDILIVRTLLEATRKIQRQFSRDDVDFKSLVFLRNDVHEHLIRETSDRGKETAVSLDWDDREVLKEIVRRRIVATTDLEGEFDGVWGATFESSVGAQPSFHFMAERTLMRPRDLLAFVRRAVDVAVNRGHSRVTDDDILQAEDAYSNEMLKSLELELRDIRADISDSLYAFVGCKIRLAANEVRRMLGDTVEPSGLDDAIRILVWFGFLGVTHTSIAEPRFAFESQYDLNKLLVPIDRGNGYFVVHPAYRRALGCAD
jgi:hypothetical protein